VNPGRSQAPARHENFIKTGCSFLPTGTATRIQLGGDLRAVSDIGTPGWTSPCLSQAAASQRFADLRHDSSHAPQTAPATLNRSPKPVPARMTKSRSQPTTTPAYLSFRKRSARLLQRFAGQRGRKCSLGFEVNGTEGSLAGTPKIPTRFGLAAAKKRTSLSSKIRRLLSPAARGYAAYPGGHTEGYPDTFVQLFKTITPISTAGDFKAPRSFPTFSTGHDELILCETIAQSAQKRAWLPIPWD